MRKTRPSRCLLAILAALSKDKCWAFDQDSRISSQYHSVFDIPNIIDRLCFGDGVLGTPIFLIGVADICCMPNSHHWIGEALELVHRYFDSNPVRSGLVAKLADYRWSRANAGSKAVVAG